MSSQPLIAVTGATGEVGRRVVNALKERGAPIRMIVRDRRRAPVITGVDVQQASGYGAFDEMAAALKGATTLMLIPATETEDRLIQHRTAVDAAVSAGIQRIVYLSFLGAAPDATFTLARDHWHTEEKIRSTAIPFTFLRMNLYLDFIPSMILPDGCIRGPAGEGRLSALLREDVAVACAAALTSDAHQGKTYELTGRENFSLAEAAALMSRPGRPVRFEDESDQQAWASRRHYGAPDAEMLGWISSYQAIRDGSLQKVTTDVRDLTGRDPTTLAEYLQTWG